MAETKYSKEMGSYSDDPNNYVAPDEITVRITLAEYRELVSVKAIKDKLVNDAEYDKYQREADIKRLKEENAALKAELYELRKKLDTEGGNENLRANVNDAPW